MVGYSEAEALYAQGTHEKRLHELEENNPTFKASLPDCVELSSAAGTSGKKKRIFEYGNYESYYSTRLDQQWKDPRVDLF